MIITFSNDIPYRTKLQYGFPVQTGCDPAAGSQILLLAVHKLQAGQEVHREEDAPRSGPVSHFPGPVYPDPELLFRQTMYVMSLKTAIDIIFLLGNILPLVWETVGDLYFIDRNSEFQRGICFLVVEALKFKTFQVPIAFYKTFVIQKKYDCNNKKTFQIFWFDQFVESGLFMIIIPPILYGYLIVVDFGGEYFYLSIEIFVFIITLILTWIYPNFIAPLLNKITELKDSPLKDKINQLAQSINFPLRHIYLMDGSVRSSHSNAYFYGFGSNQRIVLYDTLIQRLKQQEIVSVVGHQLGHWKHNHPLYKFTLYILQVFFIFYIFSFFRNHDEIFISFGFKEKSTFIGTALFFSLFDPISSVFEIVSLVISRYCEFQADEFACQKGYARPLESALTKLLRQSVSVIPDPAYAWCRHSHPSIHERIYKIRQFNSNVRSDYSRSEYSRSSVSCRSVYESSSSSNKFQ